MKRLIPLLTLAGPLFSEEAALPDTKPEVQKLSEAMGHLIGKNLQSMGLPLDIEALVRGMKDGCDGKEAPLSEDECVRALTSLQEESLTVQGAKNLLEANEFLTTNAIRDGIVKLEEGKVQYQVLQEGSGDSVQAYNSPVLRYKGHYLNGEFFGASSGEEMISLDETIEGFGKGIIGMKEGEKRALYIHPDLGYGRHGLSMPNALLVFEVELIKADASADAQAASNAEDAIALPTPAR